MSLSICLCRGLGVIKEKHAWASGLSSGFLVALCSVTLHEKPQTLSCGYLGASQGVGLQIYREVFFICSTASAQGYLRFPELVCFSCLWVNQVAHHPTSLGPSIRVARTAIFWCELCMQDKLWFWCTHQSNHYPHVSHIFWHPWVGSKRSGRILEVWFGSVELWQLTTIP